MASVLNFKKSVWEIDEIKVNIYSNNDHVHPSKLEFNFMNKLNGNKTVRDWKNNRFPYESNYDVDVLFGKYPDQPSQQNQPADGHTKLEPFVPHILG